LAEEQELRDLFERFGRVTRVFLARDRETQRAKGFAFISYADRGDAALACEKVDGCMFLPCFSIYIGQIPGVLTFSSSSSRLPPPHSPRRVRQAVYLNSFLGFLLRLSGWIVSFLSGGPAFWPILFSFVLYDLIDNDDYQKDIFHVIYLHSSDTKAMG
jgi:hypothetical protein